LFNFVNNIYIKFFRFLFTNDEIYFINYFTEGIPFDFYYKILKYFFCLIYSILNLNISIDFENIS